MLAPLDDSLMMQVREKRSFTACE